LIKNNPIETLDGIYSPETDEVWYSEKMYRDLEKKFLYK